MKFEIESLPYAYNALEPYIDAKTVEIHHDKHHATYVAKLNAAIESEQGFAFEGTLDELLGDLQQVPEKIRTAVKNNGGGVWNHNFYWKSLSPEATKPSQALEECISKSFGDMESLKKKLVDSALAVFGSGWAWLCADSDGKLKIVPSSNQDSPAMNIDAFKGLTPILTVDVWEHAYYLKYQNRRQEHVEAILNLLDWKCASERFEKRS